ncbi:hypothetical protein LCI18_007590 [Fusarium solani-melongenae]|uniref:Uncharacterized protein n=1 Tax=Fusarium solani subsp. cucurbitae TaxID=2747967 RepID=A0ACD3Z6C2_FUSSC|nr:hypothetical protein LCI18_007590 [Fusarium solani-melongenae]
MAGTSLWDYIFIRTCIFLLHLVAPLSVVYSLASLLVRLPFQPPRELQTWLALEALFYLAVYLPLKEYLQRAAKHPIMSISPRITYEAMSKEEMCDEIHRTLAAHGWEKCVLASHSYGSVVAAQLLRSPEISQHIGPIVFIDPVSFLLHLPDVAYNFICRRPSQPNEYLLSYFRSKDIGISHTLFRRFFWADNLLDSVIDTKSIRAYLLGSDNWALETTDLMDLGRKDDGLDVIWFQDLGHG